MEPETVVTVLDRIGIFAFSFAGAQVGLRRRLDVFGVLVLGLVTATGGGVIRDVMLQRIPLLLTREDYVVIALAGSVLAMLLVRVRNRTLDIGLVLADAGGLGAFAAAGAVAAIASGLPAPAAVLLAIVTACGGGVLRDLFADDVPLVFRAELSATAAAGGGLLVWALHDLSLHWAALIGALVAGGLRIVSVFFRLHLPVPGAPPPSE